LCLMMMKSGGDRRKSTLGDHMKKLQRRYYRTLQHNGRLGEVRVHDHAGTVQTRKTFPSRGWSELPYTFLCNQTTFRLNLLYLTNLATDFVDLITPKSF